MRLYPTQTGKPKIIIKDQSQGSLLFLLAASSKS